MPLPFLVPLIVSALSAYGGAANQAHAARKQDRQTAEGINQQIARRNEANARVNQQIQTTATSNPNDERQARLDEYLGALRPQTAGGQVGHVSQAYQQGAAATDKTVGDTSSQLAGVLSRIDAAGDQRRGERLGDARAASDVGVIGNLAEGDAAVNAQKVRSITPNPWIDLLSKAGMTAGSLMAGGAGTGLGGFGGVGSTAALNGGKGAVDFSTMLARRAATGAVV